MSEVYGGEQLLGYATQNADLGVVEYVASLERPLCSMSFNGIIFEEAIPGYRTIRVEGRDNFSNTIYDYSSRINPGARFQDLHEETKEITVTFALHAYDPTDLRRRVDILRGYLIDPDNREAHIIFRDEPDVYYVGTVSKFQEEKLTTFENSAGQITIKCSDIRKYSVEEYSADNDSSGMVMIDYNGTRPSYPILEANVFGDTDYVNFIDGDGHIIAVGSDSDVNADKKAKDVTTINQDFRNSLPSIWGRNQAHLTSDRENYSLQGTVVRDSDDTASNKRYGLRPSNYGSWVADESEYDWHGPSVSTTVNNDGDHKTVGWKMTASGITMWQNTPETDNVVVILKEDHVVFSCFQNNLFAKKDIDIPFACYEGSKLIPCKCTTTSMFGATLKNTDSTDKADGHIKCTIPKDTSVSDGSGKVVLTFSCTASTGTVTITKNFSWSRELKLDNRTSGGSVYNIIIRQDQYRIPTANGKVTAETKLRVSFGVYKGNNRAAASISESNRTISIGGKTYTATKYSYPTEKADGFLEWTIPKDAAFSESPLTRSITVSYTVDKKTQTLSDKFEITNGAYRRNYHYNNDNSTINVILDTSSYDIWCRSDNKQFVQAVINVPFAAYEGKNQVACAIKEITQSLNTSAAKRKNSTKTDKGYLQWTVPTSSTISESSYVFELKFEVTTAHFGTRTVIRTFTLTKQSLASTRKEYSQLGELGIIVSGTNPNNIVQTIAEVRFTKSNASSTKANCCLFVDDRKVKTIAYECIRENELTGTNKGKSTTGQTVTIEKIGYKYTFTVGGNKYQFTNQYDLIATEVSIVFFGYRSTNRLERMAVKTIKFVRHPETIKSYSEIQNKFTEGDQLSVDCGTGTIYVNGVPEYGYGALGNDYEKFALTPGVNQIQADTDGNVTFDVRYREVY